MVASRYDPVMEFSIRAAREVDTAGTAALLNPIIAAGCYTIMQEPASAASQRAWMHSVGERGVINVAVRNGDRRIVGLQSVEPISRSITSMSHVGDISTFVALDCRGCGIGRALMAETVRGAAILEYQKLVAMIRADNPDAVAFYQRQGFVVRGVMREHVRLGETFVDEVLAERTLEQRRTA